MSIKKKILNNESQVTLQQKIIQTDKNQKFYDYKPNPHNMNIQLAKNNQSQTINKIVNQENYLMPKNNAPTRSTNNSSKYFIYDEGFDKKNLKNILFQQYNTQIKRNKQRRQYQKNKKILQQKQALKKITEFQAKLEQSNQLKKIQNKVQIQNQYYSKLQDKRLMKSVEKQQKLRQLQQILCKKPYNKKVFFREFYKNHIQQSNRIAQKYVKEVYQDVKQKQMQINQILNMRGQNSLQRYQSFQHFKNQLDLKRKQEYKIDLQKQMNQKGMRRNNSESRKTDLIQRQLQNNFYNPITNHYSLGINPQNNYIVNQIRKYRQLKNPSFKTQNAINQNSSIRNITRLARNGSHSLFKTYQL